MKFFIVVIIVLTIIDMILLARKKEKNEDVKKSWLIVGITMVVFLAIPSNWNNILYSKQNKVDISSTNIFTLDLHEDLKNIKNTFKINEDLDMCYFDLNFSDKGEIQRVSMSLLGRKYNNEVIYNVLYEKDTTQGKYIISRYKNQSNYEGKIEYNYFTDKLNIIKGERPPSSDYEEYRIILLGDTVYKLRDNKAVYIDKDNKVRELTKDDSEIKGIMIMLEGTKRNGYDVNTASPSQSSIGRVDFIFDIKK